MNWKKFEKCTNYEWKSFLSRIYFNRKKKLLQIGILHLTLTLCYKVIQDFMVTGLFAGQHNTKLHGTITGDFPSIKLRPDKYNITNK